MSIQIVTERIQQMTTSNYHHGDLRSKLIEVAMIKLKNDGIEALTLRGLASALNVSRTAPYRHFKDKEELMNAIAKEGFQTFSESINLILLNASKKPVLERFQLVAKQYIQFSLENPEYYKLMFGVSNLLKAPNESLKIESDNAYKLLIDILEEGQNQGIFVKENSRSQARFVWFSLHGLCSIAAIHEKHIAQSMLEEKDFIISKIVTALRNTG